MGEVTSKLCSQCQSRLKKSFYDDELVCHIFQCRLYFKSQPGIRRPGVRQLERQAAAAYQLAESWIASDNDNTEYLGLILKNALDEVKRMKK